MGGALPLERDEQERYCASARAGKRTLGLSLLELALTDGGGQRRASLLSISNPSHLIVQVRAPPDAADSSSSFLSAHLQCSPKPKLH